MFERRIHAAVDVAEKTLEVVGFHLRCLFSAYAVTSEPTGSPTIARLMLPGVRGLNTTIGRRLSMQSEIAVASMTFKRCSRTWRYEIRSKREALGDTIGSAS